MLRPRPCSRVAPGREEHRADKPEWDQVGRGGLLAQLPDSDLLTGGEALHNHLGRHQRFNSAIGRDEDAVGNPENIATLGTGLGSHTGRRHPGDRPDTIRRILGETEAESGVPGGLLGRQCDECQECQE
jgi:hypothetical protein